jgi:hypothetical protein
MKQTSIQHFIGIDIAKQTLDVAVILSANKENIVHTTVDNTPRGFQRLVRWLSSLDGFTLDDAVFCMEHTGMYGSKCRLRFSDRSECNAVKTIRLMPNVLHSTPIKTVMIFTSGNPAPV